ncbi:zinc transporter ZIP6 [Caretta caretta]|uniref:zinc transporter ZIP6 n=1 Tax=Caretta caretta TaxID=8467 RepID=UPI003D4DC35B
MENELLMTFLLSFSILFCKSHRHEVELATVAQTSEKLIPDKAAGVNTDLAALMQKHHLQELFQRYGENNTLTIEGFRKLLQNIGIDKVKSITIGHDHDHDHHLHHNHVMLSKNLERTDCPNHESGGINKDPSNGQAKELQRIENAEHKQNLISNKNTVMEITAYTNTTATDGNPLLQNSETREVKPVHISLTSPSAMNVTDSSSCFNVSKLMTSHGISTQVLLAATEFSYLCPAIINQIDGKHCIIHAASEKTESPPKSYSLQIAWIGGLISISIISFLSLLGVILIPLMNRVFFKFLLSFLVSLAVGTLSGDAFLHLLPHSHGNHHHHHEKLLLEQNKDALFKHLVFQSEEETAYLDSTWKGLTALGGLYFMFLAEHLITLIKQFKDKKKKKKNEDAESKKFSTNEEKLDADYRPEGYLGTESQDPSHFISQQPVVQEEEEVMIAHSHQEETDNEYVSRGCRNKCHSHLHDTLGQSDHLSHHHHDYHHILHHHHTQNHHPHSHSQRYSREELKDAGIATLAWMVIMGDGLHNFSDGLAIGAAFTEGLSSGLSTSVAVFCHELPHELGDFAVLLKAGMTVKQAVLYNALSAMLAYLGMATGILIGHYADNVSMWIFALTAGLFMYVALVDMVPEMLHNDASDHGCSRWGYFLLQNAGILLGFGIMLLISVFEHKIVFSINL